MDSVIVFNIKGFYLYNRRVSKYRHVIKDTRMYTCLYSYVDADILTFYNLYGYLTKTINYLDHYKIHFQLLIYKLKTKRKLKLKNWIGFFVLFLLANWWPKFYNIVLETREVSKCACSITRSAENWQIIKFLFKYFFKFFFMFWPEYDIQLFIFRQHICCEFKV